MLLNKRLLFLLPFLLSLYRFKSAIFNLQFAIIFAPVVKLDIISDYGSFVSGSNPDGGTIHISNSKYQKVKFTPA